MEGLDPNMVIADKADDANDFIQMIQGMEAMVVIPVRSNRNLVERFFNRIKQFRCIARRYEKLDSNFMSMLNLVCTIICLAWMLTDPRLLYRYWEAHDLRFQLMVQVLSELYIFVGIGDEYVSDVNSSLNLKFWTS